VYLPPDGTQVVVPTGIKVAIPAGYVGFVCTRSGLAAKYGVQVVNAPGVIDSGYRGEVKVILNLANHAPGSDRLHIPRGDRIAQLVIVPIPPFVFDRYLPEAFESEFGNTVRGTGGFGSTGR
jgi:dUTP pyrophosphatase